MTDVTNILCLFSNQLTVMSIVALSVRKSRGMSAAIVAVTLLPSTAIANTSTVFSPDVKEGTSALEYRSSYVPSEGDRRSAFAHRLHYQHAIDDTWRWRVIGQQSRRGDDTLEYSYTRLELQMQYREDEEHGHDAALRYELQISDNSNRPDRFRVVWTGKKDFEPGWQLRSNILLGREFGESSGSGVLVEARFQVTYPVFGDSRLGIESFSDLNRTSDWGSFDDQEHQLGPILKSSLGPLKINAGYLWGASDGAPDDNFRLIATWNF